MRESRIIKHMKTVSETKTFARKAANIWSEEERLDFIAYISSNFNRGDVISGANGYRKIRWTTKGTGKRGGTRIIYLNVNNDLVLLVDIYSKSKKENWQ